MAGQHHNDFVDALKAMDAAINSLADGDAKAGVRAAFETLIDRADAAGNGPLRRGIEIDLLPGHTQPWRGVVRD